MRNSNLILLIALLVVGHCYEYKSDCVCPSWDGKMVGDASLPSTLSGFQLSNDPEVINGVDYGKLISYAGKIWLSQDVTASATTTLPIRSGCPAGYRVPTGDELRALLSAAKQDYASSPKDFLINQFRMNESNYYMTSEKTLPNLTYGGDNEAWRFTVLYFKDKLTPQMDTPSTYWISSSLRAKCVLDISNSDNKPDFILNFTKPLINGSTYSLDYKRNNVISNAWRVNGQVIGTTKKISWTPLRAGCHVIESFIVIFGGSVIRQCKISWADLSFGSSYDTRLIMDSIKNKVYSDFTANKVNSMHFNPSTAPIAARADGGAYILFAAKDSLDLYVRVTNNRGVDARTPIPLGKQGYPFDIVATPWGFVSLIRDKADSHYLYLLGNYENGSQRFLRVIMNNGLDPNTLKDQIKFYNSDGTQVFGMAAMYRPHNGRLAFSQGRIHAIFAHYNHFGFYDNGNRNDHTGDTFVSFNEDGQDERLVNSWVSSHSLFQNLVTTETKVVSASLGDAYPNNIVVTVADIEPGWVDPYTKLKNRVDSRSMDIVSGFIPGNGGGGSYGTLGGLSYLGNDLLAVTYQRKAGTTSMSTNNVNEVGIVFLYSNLTKISQVSLGDGKKANIIKSAKYGANILIAVGTPVADTDYPQRHATPATDVMTLMVVSPTGSILSQSTVYTPYCLTANDDFEVLSDGSVVWGFVDANDKLNFYRIPTKSTTVLAQKKFQLKKKLIK